MGRRVFLRLHRVLGLAALAFWLLQALTGTLLVYRWEIEDALLPGSAARADPAALGARLDAIAAAGGRTVDVWATSDSATRFDIYYADVAGEQRIMRVDGEGRPLRDAPDAGAFANGAVFDTLTLLHTRLLAGEAGGWIVSLSGVLLLVQLVAGLRLGWPSAGNWRRLLFARPPAAGTAALYGWHRSLGLWLGILILPFVVAGIGLSFEHGLRERIGQEIPLPESAPADAQVGPGQALAIAAALHPGSKLSAMVLPGEGEAWYRIRQRRPGDLSRNWGTSTILLSSADGRVLADHPSQDAPAGRRMVDWLYPFHTGQFAGFAGRGLVLIQGCWLAAMTVLGFLLWRNRRSRS